MKGKSKESTKFFKEYYEDDFLKLFKSVENSTILFIIGRNIDKTKFLVMTEDYKDSIPIKEYIRVWSVDGTPSENMAAKIKRLDERHKIIYALHKQNPNIPVRMNPFAPTNWTDFKILIRSMRFTWTYYITTVNAFRGNRVFLVNYVDKEYPFFIYENRCLFDKPDRLRNVPLFEGCKDCNSKSIKDGCSEVKKWFEKTFEGLLEENERFPVFECSSRCSCFNSKDICKNRISYLNRDKIPLVIFKTIDKGWAIGAGKDMKAGEVVTEYAGIIMNDSAITRRTDVTYIFDMDYMRPKFEYKYGPSFKKQNRYYVIDSKRVGNESRFTNHSCDPNMDIMVSYGVYKSPTIHKIFFSMNKDVPMGTELTVKYFYSTNDNPGSNAAKCKCGSSNCMVDIPVKYCG
uniref:SET domain-containing protein n=1 Tax=Strongyloides papillosus TaxID=174720 RepID=A0A0N5BF79_STREA